VNNINDVPIAVPPPASTLHQSIPAPVGDNIDELERALAAPTKEALTFSEKIAYDYALVLENEGEPLTEVAQQHNIQVEVLSQLVQRPLFQRALMFYRDYIATNGITFKIKAKVLADSLLPDMARLARDPEAAASARVDLFKHVTSLAEYVPAKNAIGISAGKDGDAYSLNISFNNRPQETNTTHIHNPVYNTQVNHAESKNGTPDNTTFGQSLPIEVSSSNIHGEEPDVPILRQQQRAVLSTSQASYTTAETSGATTRVDSAGTTVDAQESTAASVQGQGEQDIDETALFNRYFASIKQVAVQQPVNLIVPNAPD